MVALIERLGKWPPILLAVAALTTISYLEQAVGISGKLRQSLLCGDGLETQERLVAAVAAEDPGRVRSALDECADPNARIGPAHGEESNGLTAPMLAARRNLPGVLAVFEEKRFLRPRTDLATRDKNGDTALHHAARQGATESVVLLLTMGADPHAGNFEPTPLTPVDLAVLSNEPGTLEAFEGRLRKPLTHYFWQSLAADSDRIVAGLVKRGVVSADEVHADGQMALHRAIRSGASRSAGALLAAGADPLAPDDAGNTALMAAAAADEAGVIDRLIAGQVALYSRREDGKTARQLAGGREARSRLDAYRAELGRGLAAAIRQARWADLPDYVRRGAPLADALTGYLERAPEVEPASVEAMLAPLPHVDEGHFAGGPLLAVTNSYLQPAVPRRVSARILREILELMVEAGLKRRHRGGVDVLVESGELQAGEKLELLELLVSEGTTLAHSDLCAAVRTDPPALFASVLDRFHASQPRVFERAYGCLRNVFRVHSSSERDRAAYAALRAKGVPIARDVFDEALDEAAHQGYLDDAGREVLDTLHATMSTDWLEPRYRPTFDFYGCGDKETFWKRDRRLRPRKSAQPVNIMNFLIELSHHHWSNLEAANLLARRGVEGGRIETLAFVYWVGMTRDCMLGSEPRFIESARLLRQAGAAISFAAIFDALVQNRARSREQQLRLKSGLSPTFALYLLGAAKEGELEESIDDRARAPLLWSMLAHEALFFDLGADATRELHRLLVSRGTRYGYDSFYLLFNFALDRPEFGEYLELLWSNRGPQENAETVAHFGEQFCNVPAARATVRRIVGDEALKWCG